MADDHSHCDSCISPNCDHLDSCPIQICPECDIRVHSCKLEDHLDEICLESSRQCINVQYGCTETSIRRQDFIKHMQYCPVIMNLIVPSDLVQCPDCLLTINEQEMQDHHKVCLEHVVPCVNKSFGCVQSMKRKDLNHHLEHCPASIVNCGYAYERLSQWSDNDIEVHDGVLAICDENYTPKAVDEKFLLSDIKRTGRDDILSLKTFRRAYSLYDYRESYLKTMCPEIVRRDEFSSHWLSHIDFIDFLPQIVTRCPLFSYGCTYSLTKFQPSPKGYTLDYNPGIPSFIVQPSYPKSLEEQTSTTAYEVAIAKKQELVAYGYSDTGTGSLDMIGQLPVEVLFDILSYCDSQSLWALSQVNTYLRELCWELVTKKGVVYCKWSREDKGKSCCWNSKMVWSFSKIFHYSGELFIQLDCPGMAHHVQQCEVFKKLQDTDKYQGEESWEVFPAEKS